MTVLTGRSGRPCGPGRRPAGRAGQGMVEFALALTVLLLVVLGSMEVALLAHTRQVVVSAAQEGARVASAEGRTLTEGRGQAQALLARGLGARADLFTVTAGCAVAVADVCTAETVAIRVSGAYPLQVLGRAPLAIPLEIEISMFTEYLRDGR